MQVTKQRYTGSLQNNWEGDVCSGEIVSSVGYGVSVCSMSCGCEAIIVPGLILLGVASLDRLVSSDTDSGE